jgi:DMSO/TMAO reductase YedYZ heme-binding membrane subunit
MDPIELSGFAGLTAIGLLTANILIGLLMSVKYNPVRNWPHRRINTVMLHNYTGWAALIVSLAHPLILLLPNRVDFHLSHLLWPLDAPKQPIVNTFGAAALYILLIVVLTSWRRFQIGRKWWKRIHFITYAMFPIYAVHAILTNPRLNDKPIDYLDGEKVWVVFCLLLVAVAMTARIRWQLHQPPARVHRPKQRAGPQLITDR